MYKNMVRCRKCNDLIESKHRHDFVSCSCGSVSVDGGLAYRRVLWRGGEYDEVVENYLELVKPIDVQLTANISARERDFEQEYYNSLYKMLIDEEATYEQSNDIRPRDDDGKREVPVPT